MKHFILFLFLINSIAYNEVISINAVGDIMLGTTYPKKILPPEDGKNFFKDVSDYLNSENRDLLLGNLEGPITEWTNSPKGKFIEEKINKGEKPKAWAFRMPIHYATYLSNQNFSFLSLANNHAMDFGIVGFTNTIDILRKNNIKAAGRKGDYVVFEVKSKKIAIVPFSWIYFSNNYMDEEESLKLIRNIKKSNDIVILSVHAGSEGNQAIFIPTNTNEYLFTENRGNFYSFSLKAIDNGADLILGHGPHVPRGLYLYKDRLIAYSLGNFATYTMSTDGYKKYSLVLNVKLNLDGSFNSGKIMPVILRTDGWYNGIPAKDTNNLVIPLIRKLSFSNFQDNKIEITEEGLIKKVY